MKQLLINISNTIVEVLLNNKILFIVFTGIIFQSSKAQELNSNDLKRLNPTHEIKSEIIYELIRRLESKEKLFSNKSDCAYLEFRKNKKNNFIITGAYLSFLDCKILTYETNKILKGYLKYKDKTVFLYGNIDNNYFLRKKVKIINVMKSSYKVDKNHPPIALHINLLEFNIIDNKLVEGGVIHSN